MFLSQLGLAAVGAPRALAAKTVKRFPVVLFEKPLQGMPVVEMARALAGIGFDGVEATVRRGGRIVPERAAEELPGYVAALAAEAMSVFVMATDIRRVDQPHAEATLRAAAHAGVKVYRLGGENYDLTKPVLPQLATLRGRWLELAALNRELGLTAVYQNHAGSRHVGASVWDLHRVLEGISPRDIGVAFDIRHAMIEGVSSWPIDFELIRPWIKAVYVKDFVFEGARPRNVPMGTGVVGTAFYRRLKASNLSVPVSLHCPHVRTDRPTAVAAVAKDFTVLSRLLA